MKFLSSEALRSRMLEALRNYVRRRARREPLVLVWEDLHWCDPSSWEVLETLFPLSNEVPLLLLCAADWRTIACWKAADERRHAACATSSVCHP